MYSTLHTKLISVSLSQLVQTGVWPLTGFVAEYSELVWATACVVFWKDSANQQYLCWLRNRTQGSKNVNYPFKLQNKYKTLHFKNRSANVMYSTMTVTDQQCSWCMSSGWRRSLLREAGRCSLCGFHCRQTPGRARCPQKLFSAPSDLHPPV